LLPGGETITHTRTSAIEELSSHCPDASLYLSGEYLLGQLLEAVLEACELYRWPTTAAPLATPRAVATPLLSIVRVVDVAVVGAAYRYPLTGFASLRYA
jgi:hypothetical protein